MAKLSSTAVVQRQFSSLTVYNYRIYFFGQMFSQVGTWMQTTGQAWLVLHITGSARALGTVALVQFLPITVFALFGGVIADRVPKRKLLMCTQTSALLQALAFSALALSGHAELWQIYLLAFWLGLGNAIDGPSRQSFVMDLVGREQLVNAVALNSTLFNVARICGPALAGIVIGTLGVSWIFFFNAVSFLGVLAAYFFMRPAEFKATQRKAVAGNVFGQIGEGLRYVGSSPTVLFLFVVVGVFSTFTYNFTVVIPLVARFGVGVGPERFGILTSCLGAGALVSALTLAGNSSASTRVMNTSLAIFIALFTLLAWSESFWLTAAILAGCGATGVAFTKAASTRIQLLAPDHLRGRVMSIWLLLMAGSTPVGGYLTGLMTELWSVRAALGIEAAICIAGVGGAFAFRALRERGAGPAVGVGAAAEVR